MKRERRTWRILSYTSPPYDMQSFIVWTMAGMAQGETAGREMRRWSEPRVIVVDLVFSTRNPRRRGGGLPCCQPSCQAGKKKLVSRKSVKVDTSSTSGARVFILCLSPPAPRHFVFFLVRCLCTDAGRGCADSRCHIRIATVSAASRRCVGMVGTGRGLSVQSAAINVEGYVYR